METKGLASQMAWVRIPGFYFNWEPCPQAQGPQRQGMRLLLKLRHGAEDGPEALYLVAVHDRWRSGLEKELLVECAQWPGASPQPLMILPCVTRSIHDRLFRSGVSFLDWEGSYELRILDPNFQGVRDLDLPAAVPPGILAFVSGRRILQVPRGVQPASRAPVIRLAGRSQQVAISLLLAPSLSWETQTQLWQHLQKQGGILTPTQVSRALICLEDRGLVERQGTRAFRVIKRHTLYQARIESWPRAAPSKRLPLVYWQVPEGWETELAKLGLCWRYSGGSMLRRHKRLLEAGPWEILAAPTEANAALAALGGSAVENRLKANVAVNGNAVDNDFYPRFPNGEASPFHILKDLELGMQGDGRQWDAAAPLMEWLHHD